MIKFYLYVDDTFDNIEMFERMVYLVIKKNIKFTKCNQFYASSEMEDKDFNKLSLSIYAFKYDLKINTLAFIVVPKYDIRLLDNVCVKESKVYYLYDIMLEKYYKNELNFHLYNDLIVNVNEDVLYTVKQYIIQDMSVSKTAEVVFAHRNTINYRISKFINITSIDIHNIHNAMIVYFILNNKED